MSFHDFIERAWAYGIKPKSRRKITAQQMYPWAVERQLQADLKAEFTKAGLFYKEQALKGTQSLKDNADDLLAAEFNNDERLRPLAERVAYEVEKFQQACFENFSEVVIGERYIPAVVGPSVTETWENNFLTLCRSTNDDLKKKVSEIISNAVMNGNNIADTAKQIDDAVGNFSYSKALTIARTETGKLNMAISKAQMEEAGIDKYEWSCMMDERSRPSHEKMDGKVCIWSNPNVVYNIKTKKTEPRPQSAVHLHPGDDYNCRCVALPWDELIEQELNQKKGKPNKQWLELKEEERQKEAEKRAEREEIKRNKELVPQLTAENEKLQKRIDKMSQELLEEQLEREGLEETLNLGVKQGEPHEEILHVHTSKGNVKLSFIAESRQEAKYMAYLEIKNNPEKYGTDAVVPKFNAEKFINENPSIIAKLMNSITSKTKTLTATSSKVKNTTTLTTNNVVRTKVEQDNIDLVKSILHCKELDATSDEIKNPLSISHNKVNPKYKKGNPATANNCPSTAYTTVLRHKGLDVQAVENPKYNGSSSFDDITNYRQIAAETYTGFLKPDGKDATYLRTDYTYKNGIGTLSPSSSRDVHKSRFKEYTKKDGLYIVTIKWDVGGGHAFNYYVKNGVGTVLDNQGPNRNGRSIDWYLNSLDTSKYMAVLNTDGLLIDKDLVSYITKASTK